MVTELVLPGVALEETVEFDVPAAESSAVIPGVQATYADFLLHTTHGAVFSGLPWADPPG